MSLLDDQLYVAFDTETTGLWAPAHRIVEIAGVKFRPDGTELGSFQRLINPGRAIPAEVVAVHGITDTMVADADGADTVLAEFESFCGPQTILVAHNAGFDISFVCCELQRLERTFGPNRVLDTVDISRRAFPGKESYSLQALAQGFGLIEKQEHRALGDAQLVRQIFLMGLSKLPKFSDWGEVEANLEVSRMDSWRQEAVELPEQFAPITQAIKNDGRVEFCYSSPMSNSSTRIVKPLQVYAHNSRLYLSAFCFAVNAERTFRLDRISRLLPVDD